MLTHHAVVAEMENLRVRVNRDLNDRLTKFSDLRRISKQDIVEGMLEWMLHQDEVTQAMILRQIPASDQLLAFALYRLHPRDDSDDADFEAFKKLMRAKNRTDDDQSVLDADASHKPSSTPASKATLASSGLGKSSLKRIT